MTFKEMVKDGVQFTSNGERVTITDTDVYITVNKDRTLMLGVLEDGSYQFFDPIYGTFIQYNGKPYRDSMFNLIPFPVEKEGWFAIVKLDSNKVPVLSGIYRTKQDCEANVTHIFAGRTYEVHKILYTM